MKSVAINYQTSYMSYSKAIKLYKNILNDIYKNEPDYEKICFKSRKTDDINNELIEYFLNHENINDSILNKYNDAHSNDSKNSFCILFESTKTVSIKADMSLSISFICTCNNKCYVHIYIRGPVNTLIDDNKESYQCISINPEIIQLIPNVINNEIDNLLESYTIQFNSDLINDIPDIFKKYSMKCIGCTLTYKD